jgi:hypothetical protein
MSIPFRALLPCRYSAKRLECGSLLKLCVEQKKRVAPFLQPQERRASSRTIQALREFKGSAEARHDSLGRIQRSLAGNSVA